MKMNSLKKIAYLSLLIFAFAFQDSYALIVDINAKINNEANPIEAFLDAGTYQIEVIGTANGGLFNSWSAWSFTTCTDPLGCINTRPTTNTGWLSAFQVTSPNITSVAVEGTLFSPESVIPTTGPKGSFFVVSPGATLFRVYDGYVYPDELSSLSRSLSSTFTLGAPGVVGFSIFDATSALGDNRGGVSLNLVMANHPPTADAGADFSVNEGQTGVTLDGSGSSDPDGDTLTYAWTQVGATTVTLSGATTAMPTFDAPTVAVGGETLSFQLQVTTPNGESSTDTVSVTVVNVNHPPVADAGLDQSIAEGSPVTLHGEDSFDIDNDGFTYTWVQIGGLPMVTLTGANTANPTFTAPVLSTGGAPGVVATLVFELTVDDGFPQAAPASGFNFGNVVDYVTVEITNVNNDPTADAGLDQTVDEHSAVAISGTSSSDPDSDPLTYAWTQVGGPGVALTGSATATPSFTAPFVSAGGTDFEFKLTVDDGYGGTATDTVVIHVQDINDPPLASAARPTIDVLWPPNHGLVAVGIVGVSDPDNNATISIDSVFQDEPTNGQGDGDTAVDAVINAGSTVLLRAERSGNGNGRVYHIHFTASDFEGSASGVVTVGVPHNKKSVAIDGGEFFDSTN
jgi:K319L-like, PKD domain